ncbi:cadherin EGF LAG seven-pass G-type receptor 1-like [Sardina pilchardus]|uniref:cadherin EGF LAG seven-pass G-type receptor 1-like n=1 Tax=Sardina pilchardus TaxID=27697 RepID=UPI002E13C22E
MEVGLHWTWVSLICSLPLMGCLNLHVSDTSLPGDLLKNVSLGPGWTYKIDRTLTAKYVREFVTVDWKDGAVRVSRRADCVRLPQNPAPLYVKIRSVTSENVVLTHCNVYVHGQNCFIKYKRKSSIDKPDISADHLFQLGDTSCLSSGNLLVNVNDFLPESLKQTTSSRYSCTNAYGNAVVNNGSLFLNHEHCPEPWERSEMFFWCTVHGSLGDSVSMRVRLLFWSNARHVSSESLQNRPSTRHLRIKRAPNSAPTFQLPNYQVSVPENEPAGTRVINVKATDTDSGEAGRIKYAMEALFDKRSDDLFVIDPQTGSIVTAQPLDREVKDTHVFKVTATDHGSPPRAATSYLTVTVRDTNDHSPVFEQSEYRVTIRENVEVGFEVITIRANDGDTRSNANMVYRIVNGDGVNSGFEIDPQNGLVKIRVSPDRETMTQYKLIVEANDQGRDPGPRNATATVYITVEDENDNYPQFSEKRYVVQVPENVAVNTQVAQVAATDKDEGNNAKVLYSIISGNVKGQFYIHSSSGVIDVINPLDYEMIREYNLRIKAQDGGRPPLINGTGMVVIQVVDINDNAPMFVSTPFQATVLENVAIGHSVIHIQAIDADAGDNARLDYRLTDTSPGFPFTVNNSTGWVTVSSELDRETTEFYTFGVEARDNGVPAPLSSSASISITVLDVNDNVPEFTQRSYSLKINEDAVVGTSVLTVTAVDRDVNSIVTYQIASGNTRNRFAITSQSGGGLLTLALPLDYKQERQYALTLTASDGTRFDTAHVLINVTDANTHRPVFQSANYQVLVSEDKPVGATVVVISASDEDTGENARITYVMEDNVPQFAIHPDTGAVTTRTELDYEDQASYTLAIVARDNGIPQKSDTTYVELMVLDANDNAPRFGRDKYQGSVHEDAPTYTSVLQISATDLDSGSNGRLTYTFAGGDDGEGDFQIETYSGIIRTARKLDRENVAVYQLKAFAVDKGVPALKASVDVRVSVLDINDNAPKFEKDRLDIYVKEDSAVDSVVERIVAEDPDEGTNAQIIYQIVEGNVPEMFDLDIFSGDLKLLAELDYETRSEYVIVVQATSAPLVSRATVHVHVQDVNDNKPVLRDFEILFNNYVTNKSNSFPAGVIGRVPAHDPDVSDQLHYSLVEGNELGLLLLNPHTGELKLSRDLDNNRPLQATMKMAVSDGLHRVTALCTLRVTIITDDMLTNSITVRLENMSQERFLSPLLSLFMDGVAAVLSTSRDGVFVFNVQNDTDVHGAILNVTFSALLPSATGPVTLGGAAAAIGGGGGGGGAGGNGRFFPSEDLQERIYLNRTMLQRISSQQVLPFDDNICLREPCENYMKCISVLRFDSSPPFIASDTMLFRPIHPINGLRCRCPAGFTGDYCETEVDLCYSGPCRNNGRCRSREGGYTCECQEDFTGEHCEVNARSGRCVPGVCKNGGTCVDLLVGGFMCQCPVGEFEKPFCEMTTRSFPGQSFITFRGLRQRFHFTVSFMFATRDRNALLLYNGRFNEKHDFIAVEIIEEQVQLTFSAGEAKTIVAPFVQGGVSDGQWHSVQLHYYNKPNIGRLGVPHGPSGEKVAVVAVDDCDIAMAVRFGSQIGNYNCAAQGTQTGQKKSLDLTGPLLLGGVPNLPEDFPILNRDFRGCMRNLTIDSRPLDMASYIANNGTEAGCRAKSNFCTRSVCVNGGQCENRWGTYSCDCPTGYGGKNCDQGWSSRVRVAGGGFVDCVVLRLTFSAGSVRVLLRVERPCPRGWWGSPMCGPCSCEVSKGFHSDCNKTTGECRCKDNYYQPQDSDTCFPCDCFALGAESRSCDPLTGQCPCKAGVIGRQCNRCDNPFAEVTVSGCEVVYEGCPKAFDAGIWWPKTKFGRPAATHCPKGSVGTAIRHCGEERGWLPPDLFNCTSNAFVLLKKLNEEFHRNESRMDGERSKEITRQLQNATNHTSVFYGNDVRVAFQLLRRVLQYESRRSGFQLAATQDADFHQNVVEVGSAILDVGTRPHWEHIQRTEGGTAHLLHSFEDYTHTLVQNMRKTYLKPFTIVTDNMIIAVDYLDPSEPDTAKIPRFQEIQDVCPKDLKSSVLFPEFSFRPLQNNPPPTEEPTEAQPEEEQTEGTLVESRRRKRRSAEQPEEEESRRRKRSAEQPEEEESRRRKRSAEQPEEEESRRRKRRSAETFAPMPVAAVIIYRTLGQLLPERYDPDRRSLRLPKRPVINTPIVSTTVHSDGDWLALPLATPLLLHYNLLETEDRTKPVCVFWNHSIPIGGTGGWSSKGCELAERNRTHISCHCNHMTSFAVLMDISKREHGDVLPLKIVTYTSVTASLVALFITFILLLLLRRLRSNLHSIHKNLVAALFISQLVFLIGINQTDNPFVCTVIAILLHYFYMCTFAWMFVEGLHIYRMLTEVRNINHGHMRFYYAIGWGIPAIITGLAVGLDPQGYGNPDFCWLSVHDTLIWSFAGPISVVVLVNIVIFLLAAKASCGRRQRSFEKSGAIGALRMAFLLLLLISATWLLGLMAVNSDVMTFHYLFAIFSCLQGIFIFLFHCIFNKEVRKNLKNVFTGKKPIPEESSTTRASLLTRSLNCNTHTEDGTIYRSAIGESTVSMETTGRSAKSSYLAYTLRDDSGQKPSVSSSGARAGITDIDGPLFHRNGTKADDSDSDSELSADEHSSSYASSHSSDSEDDDDDIKPKWNNERQPLHSTPKVETVSNHTKPYWPADGTTASDSEDLCGAGDRLRVETKVNVELHPENKLNHTPTHAETPSPPPPPPPPSDKENAAREISTPTPTSSPAPNTTTATPNPASNSTHNSTPTQSNSNNHPEQRKGILKNKISYPPPLSDKNMKNRLREKLSDYNPPTISSRSPSQSSVTIAGGNNVLSKPPAQRPVPPPRDTHTQHTPQHNGVTINLNGGNQSDSEMVKDSPPL